MARNSNLGVIDLIAASPPHARSLCNELHQRAQCDKYPCGYGYLPPQTGLAPGQFSSQSQLKTSNLVLNLGYLITEKTLSGNSIKIILASHVPSFRLLRHCGHSFSCARHLSSHSRDCVHQPTSNDACRTSAWGKQTQKRKNPRFRGGFSLEKSGGNLLSQGVYPQVPLARSGLTSVFGMGTGVTPTLWPPETFCPSDPSIG